MTIFAGDAPVLDRRTLLDIPAQSGEVFDAAFSGAFSTNPTTSLFRSEELAQQADGRAVVMGPESYLAPNTGRLEPDSPMMEAQVARDRVAGMGLDIKIPEQGIREGALDVLVQRHREQAARQQILARSNGGSMGTQIAASLAASLLDPLNIASAFVPVVGEARYAALLERAAGPLSRAGVRAGVGATEGAVGAAILEPLPLLAAAQDQTEYGLSDSLANIALGGVLGGGLHSIGGAASDALRRRLATETPAANGAPAVAERQSAPTAPAQSLRAADFERLFDQDTESALRSSLARGLEADRENLMQGARQKAIREVQPYLEGERVGTVSGLRAERVGLVQRDMALDASLGARVDQLKQQGVPQKQAVDMAKQAIGIEREAIRSRQSGIDTLLERNNAGDLDRAGLELIDRGQVPARLERNIEARAKQIMAGYEQRPLGAAVSTARDTAESADWKVRESAFRSAVAQAVSGRDIDVNAIFDLEDPAKNASALEYVKRDPVRRADAEGQSESLRVDDQAKAQASDELEATRQAYDDDKALTDETLNQLSPEDRAVVEAAGREEVQAAEAQAARAEQYAKAYRAAAVCDIRNGK